MRNLIFTTMLLALGFSAKAQQDAEYSMYMFNGLYLNPAYAGSHEVVSLTGLYRHQWSGVDGAPNTTNISVHTPFKRDQYAVGLTVANDRLGLTDMFSSTGAFAYRIKVKQTRICLGIQAGFVYYKERLSQVDASTSIYDASFAVNKSLFVPNFGFGIYVYGKKYFIGASVPHLLNNGLEGTLKVNATGNGIARQYRHWLLTAGYVFGKESSVVKFKPSFLMKYVHGLNKDIPDFDVNLSLLFIDRIWVGATLRTGGDFATDNHAKAIHLSDIIGMLEFKVTPQLRVGYSYDYSLSDLRHFNTGTHEIMLGYDFWYDKKRFVTPRYVKYF